MSTDTDPVCGMKVETGTGRSLEYDGKRHYFCSQPCLEKFQANPAKYLEPVVATAVHATGIYTCPMHPEIRQPAPGSCPICGMALEPESPPTPGAIEYTCPMHPQIVRSEPGSQMVRKRTLPGYRTASGAEIGIVDNGEEVSGAGNAGASV